MKPVRELMGDKRVAAVLASLAAIALAVRFFPAVSARTFAPHPSSPQAAGQTPTAEVAGAESRASSPNREAAGKTPAPVASVGSVSWSWNRNPFLPQWKGRHAVADARVNGSADGEGTAGGPDLPAGLRGTVMSGQSGMALFGNRIVPVGGRIGNWTVENVEQYSVTLRSGGEVRVVELFKPMPRGARGGGGGR